MKPVHVNWLSDSYAALSKLVKLNLLMVKCLVRVQPLVGYRYNPNTAPFGASLPPSSCH